MENDRKARAAAAQKKASKNSLLGRNLLVVAAITIAVAIIGGTFYAVQKTAPTYSSELVTPATATDDYGVTYTPEDAGTEADGEPVRVTIYEDFVCPYCKIFEDSFGPTLTSYVEEGKVQVEYRPVAFLDAVGGSSNDYGKRAASAALCVREEAGGAGYKAMHDALYENQPTEGSAGPDDNDLLSQAQAIEENVDEACVKNQKYVPWIKAATDAFSESDINGTPTVLIDGEVVPTEEVPARLKELVSN